MTITNRQAVESAYQAFGDGDLARFTELLDPGFVSTQSEATPWRGRYAGPEAVRGMFDLVCQRAETRYRPEEFIDGRDRIVVLGQAEITPRTDRRRRIVREVHVWRVDSGRLLSLDVFLNAPEDLLHALEGDDRSPERGLDSM